MIIVGNMHYNLFHSVIYVQQPQGYKHTRDINPSINVSGSVSVNIHWNTLWRPRSIPKHQPKKRNFKAAALHSIFFFKIAFRRIGLKNSDSY